MSKESVKKEIKKEEKVAKKSDTTKTNKKGWFKDFKAELKKVVWPTPKELLNSTVAVIVIVLITAIIVFFLDVVFESLNTYGLDKVRDAVSNSVQDNETEDDTDSQVEIVTDEDSTDEETSDDETGVDVVEETTDSEVEEN
jgi:preprotein translocase subunit SecE